MHTSKIFLECFTRKFKRNYLYVKERQTKLKCLFCRWRKTSPKHKCRFEREKNNIKMHSFKYLHMYIVHALHPSMTFLFRSESFFAYFSTFCCALQMSTDNYLQAKDNTPLHDTHLGSLITMIGKICATGTVVTFSFIRSAIVGTTGKANQYRI